MPRNAIVIAGLVLVARCDFASGTASPFTLYRNSGLERAMRVHWATFDATEPLSMIFTYFFNHQTHHRGQVHAMLTVAGKNTGDTDLFLMPRELWPN